MSFFVWLFAALYLVVYAAVVVQMGKHSIARLRQKKHTSRMDRPEMVFTGPLQFYNPLRQGCKYPPIQNIYQPNQGNNAQNTGNYQTSSIFASERITENVDKSNELKPITSDRFIASQTYEKLSFFQAMILLVKACFALGIFASSYGFAKVGYILGSIICLIVCYIICYCEYTMGDLANTIEEENEDTNLYLNTYYDILWPVLKKLTNCQ